MPCRIKKAGIVHRYWDGSINLQVVLHEVSAFWQEAEWYRASRFALVSELG
jgi:hypothetical protein